METVMSEQVKAVVNSFRHLTNGEQTTAYLDIETMWKTLQDNESTDRSGQHSDVGTLLGGSDVGYQAGEAALAYSAIPPDMPPPTLRTALCVVDPLCFECDRVRRLDLAPLARRYRDTPLRSLPLRCECGSRSCRVIVSGQAFR